MKPNTIAEIDSYLQKLYQTFAYPVYSPDRHHQAMTQNICLTYGEILTPSLCKLLDKINPSADDVWLDLGSGMGKTLLTTLLYTPIRKLIGYEANDQLTQIARQLLAHLPEEWQHTRQVQLETANFLEKDFNAATIVYICSTCFTESLLDAISEKLNHSSHVRLILSLKPLVKLRLPFWRTFRVECSWDTGLIYAYHQV